MSGNPGIGSSLLVPGSLGLWLNYLNLCGKSFDRRTANHHIAFLPGYYSGCSNQLACRQSPRSSRLHRSLILLWRVPLVLSTPSLWPEVFPFLGEPLPVVIFIPSGPTVPQGVITITR
ncbi:hypothetical protein BD779DRAFT_913817 [Infundibulicybe gibba]|nr:hypothetical protein BD779DRAFT_913817 [Infundibulicybe gibba]